MQIARASGITIAVLVAALATCSNTASAFDTAPHFDITADVLRSEGFSNNAIEIIQTANFLVDFHEFMGVGGITKALDPVCLKRVQKALDIGDAQHFDDLEDTPAVAQKWDAMISNTKSRAALKALPPSLDMMGELVLLGMSLHNVQDFYAHSNWVEDPPLGPGISRGALAKKYGDHPTWLSVDRADREQLDIYTRHHYKNPRRWHGRWDSNSDGSKPDSLNKDWSGRPKHTDAYICAWFATRQWVRLYKTWVNNPVVWDMMQKWSKDNPAFDYYAAEKISFYGGHWNGNGTGYSLTEMKSRYAAATSPDLMIQQVLGYLGGSIPPCLTSQRTKLRAKAQELLEDWGLMKYSGPENPVLPSPAPENMRFVQLKVHRIDNINGDDGLTGGEMDWYSKSEIAGQKYMSGLIDEHDNFNFDIPPYAPWTMTKAVAPNTDSVLMGLKLMELDYVDDDVVDIDPDTNQKTLVFRWKPATGQFTGDITGTGNVVSRGAGDCDCAQVVLSANSIVASCLK